MVNFDDYSEIKTGEKENTKIIDMLEGIATEFLKDKYWENFKGSDIQKAQTKRQRVLKIICENGAEEIYFLPENKKFKPKSRMSLFKYTYGSYPKIGMTVTTKANENGIMKIVLET